ncbi:MAG: hypothetical protein ISR95_00970 [Candidatus Marinimicrobia bacterium]|nr:hypothetical protein [Candidatus Neomarinimicrobiota bacterium]MBL7046203.1 hypothetical protein [Candidatus Neomarinimicrobiota bacterium]
MIKKLPTDTIRGLLSQKGLILLGPTLAVFILLILLSFTLIRLIVNEENESTNYVVEAKARHIAMTGLERGIQQFRRTRVPPSFTDIPFGTGTYTVRFDTLRDETGTTLPWCNYVMIRSRGNVADVERNVRVVLSSLPHAFLFGLYSQNLDDKQFDLKGDITSVSGDVYFRGDVKTTENVTGTVYTPPGYISTLGPITYHPEPQPPFPYFDPSYFDGLLDTVDLLGVDKLHIDGGTLDLSTYENNTIYVKDLKLKNSTAIGPGRIVANKKINIDNSIVDDDIIIVSSGAVTVKNGSTVGTGICYPNDGVIFFAKGNGEIKESTFYGLVIVDPSQVKLNDCTYYGAVLSTGKVLDMKNSTITGSLVIKGKAQIKNCLITRGPLPLVLSKPIGLEPYIIPGTWLEY